MPSFDAVLFDLDGVVIDTTALHYRVWDEFARGEGYVPSPSELLATNGRRAEEVILGWLGAGRDHQEVTELTAKREAFYHQFLATEPLQAVPGVAEFIARLERAGLPIALATSAIPANANLALSRLGLAGRFDVMVTASDVVHGKPHPECYLTAASRLGVAPERCVVVEDALSGLAAGKAAGARVLALTTSFDRATLLPCAPTWIASDFNDLPDELKL